MKAPFGHWLTRTFIAGLRCYGLTAPWVIDGPMARHIFETYVETQPAPMLQKGNVGTLDDLAAHKSEKAAACLKKRGTWFLSACSPDFNSIESSVGTPDLGQGTAEQGRTLRSHADLGSACRQALLPTCTNRNAQARPPRGSPFYGIAVQKRDRCRSQKWKSARNQIIRIGNDGPLTIAWTNAAGAPIRSPTSRPPNVPEPHPLSGLSVSMRTLMLSSEFATAIARSHSSRR